MSTPADELANASGPDKGKDAAAAYDDKHGHYEKCEPKVVDHGKHDQIKPPFTLGGK